MQESLLQQVGGIRVDFLTGPFRKGFQITATSQGDGCSPNDCSAGGCAC